MLRAVTPLPDVAKVIRVTLVFTIGSDTHAITRFFVNYSGTAPSNSDLNTFCGAVRSAFNTNLKSLCHALVVLTTVEAVDLTSTSGATGSDSTSVTGTRAGLPCTGDAAVVVSYPIARRYRGGHPRGYWPFGVAGDLATPQQWGATLVNAVNTGITAFFTAVRAAGWTGAGDVDHVNVSYFHGSHVVTNPTTGRARNVPDLRATPLVAGIANLIVRARPGSQRRRNST